MERLSALRFGGLAAVGSLLHYVVFLCIAGIESADVIASDLNRLALGAVFVASIGFATVVAITLIFNRLLAQKTERE